jgi:molybdopterin-guanine dinucleotide biosynthesis protein A
MLAVRAGRALAAVCAPAVEAGPGVSGLPHVRDHPPGAGPLAGLLAAVEAFALDGPVIVLACDMPRADVPILRLLADWPGEESVVPRVDGRAQYACARWSAAAITRARSAGDPSLRALVGDDTVYLDEDGWSGVAAADAFRDVDTPDDLGSLGL